MSRKEVEATWRMCTWLKRNHRELSDLSTGRKKKDAGFPRDLRPAVKFITTRARDRKNPMYNSATRRRRDFRKGRRVFRTISIGSALLVRSGISPSISRTALTSRAERGRFYVPSHQFRISATVSDRPMNKLIDEFRSFAHNGTRRCGEKYAPRARQPASN